MKLGNKKALAIVFSIFILMYAWFGTTALIERGWRDAALYFIAGAFFGWQLWMLLTGRLKDS